MFRSEIFVSDLQADQENHQPLPEDKRKAGTSDAAELQKGDEGAGPRPALPQPSEK